MLRLAAVYSLFVLYATTVPFSVGLSHEQLAANIARISWIPFVDPDGSRASVPDVVQNVLLLLPLGAFIAAGLARRTGRTCQLVTAAGWGLALSAGAEALQLFTFDRTTSATDVATNTLGAAAGALAAMALSASWSKTAARPGARRLLQCRAALPALAALAVVVAGAWQPFDFTLDIGSVAGKAKALWLAPIDFPAVPSDEAAVALRMALLVVALGFWLREAGVPRPRARAAGWALVLGLGLEASQIVVGSRMPGAQDGLAACAGIALGAVALPLVERTAGRAAWVWTVVAATALAAAVSQLSPFHFTGRASPFGWTPLMAHYQRTNALALADFFEAALLYFPMGFLLAIRLRGGRLAWVLALAVTALISIPLEFAQQHVAGRYADVSDPIFALVGAAAGVYACRVGWRHIVGADDEGSVLTMRGRH